MSTSTDTTEISSKPNSSCRLQDFLNTLPFHDQRVFRSLLGHIELLRLSACCHSLRSSIRNDRALWQALYHRDFLSGAHYAEEMEFVLWCVRTDVNNPCTSDKRADLLENVDWYDTYRRRVSTENNWRFGRCKTTHIDMKSNKDGICYIKDVNDLVSIQPSRSGGTSGHSYSLEYLPHPNLRSNNNIVYSSTLSTSPNVLSLGSGNEAQYKYVMGDHYIAAYSKPFRSNANYNVKILSRKHGSIFTTFNVPVQYEVKTIEGKWALLVREPQESSNSLRILANVMAFDIDNSIMCPGSIDGIWNATCFHKTTNNTAIVYTARVAKDGVRRIEWALCQFSSSNPVVQLRNGWFQLPEGMIAVLTFAQNSYDSHMIIKFIAPLDYTPYIIHSVASNGQSHTTRNCYNITDQHIPTPLLRAGYKYLIFDFCPTKIWTDLTYSDDQVLQIPGTIFIQHIIGDLYVFVTERNHVYNRLLVDINTKGVIGILGVPNTSCLLDRYAMAGMLCGNFDHPVPIIQEYGEQ